MTAGAATAGLRARRVALLLAAASVVAGGACLSAWRVDGLLYACNDAGACPEGLTCDDGVCCQPGGSPPCPTQAANGVCPDGAAPRSYFEDADRDGFGNPNITKAFCTLPVKTAWAVDARDCDDANPTIKPTGLEACNGRDDDCDGTVDEGLSPRITWYRDADGDGFGEAGAPLDACTTPPGYADKAGDCAPQDVGRYPGAPERCNGADDNCDGRADEGPFADAYDPGVDAEDAFVCNGPGLGLCAAANLQCRQTGGDAGLVCTARHAAESETCNQVDDDCDGALDNAPGCGGPPSIAGAKATFTAERVAVAAFSNLLGRCAKGYSAVEPPVAMTWVNPVWVLTTQRLANQNEPTGGTLYAHLWAMEAGPGDVWDLSGPGATLHLNLTWGAGVLNPGELPGGGTDLFGPATRHRQPVVTLCTAQGQVVRQYQPAANPIEGNDNSFRDTVPLAGSAAWTVTGSGDLSRVKRVEVVMSTRAPSSTQLYPTTTVPVTFLPDAGFFGGGP